MSLLGAPQVILKLINNKYVCDLVEKDVQNLGERGVRSLAIARTYEVSSHTPGGPSVTTTEWVMMGLLTFLDPPRPDTLQTLDEAQRYGVAVKMITGNYQLQY